MTTELRALAAKRGADDLLELHDPVARIMLREKGLHPYHDFPTGPAYHLMGIDIPTFAHLRDGADHRLDRAHHGAAGVQPPDPPAVRLPGPGRAHLTA